MYTSVVDKENFVNSLEKSISNIQNVIKSESVAYRHISSNLITDKLVTSLRFIQSDRGIPRIIESMLLETCYKSEIAGANSSDLASVFTLFLIEEIITLNKSGYTLREIHNIIKNDSVDFSNNIYKIKREATEKELHDLIKEVVGQDRLSSMVIESLKLAGLEGTIYPEHTKTNTYSVELINGYRFETSPPKTFYDKNGKWQRQYPKVLVIDGIIERVSEIHALLESLTKTKESAIFISRGFGDEVLSTLKLNQNRRTLDIIPIIVPYDLGGINMVNDLSVVCGAPLVSALKGDLISSVRYDDLSTVESATCQGKYLTIINNKTEKEVKYHMSALCEKRDQQSVEDISELLLNRIKTLGAYCVRMRLGSKTQQEENYELEAVDMGLRLSRSAREIGIVTLKDIKIPDSPLGRAISKAIEFSKNEIKPAISIMSAIHHGVSMAIMVSSIEKAILNA